MKLSEIKGIHILSLKKDKTRQKSVLAEIKKLGLSVVNDIYYGKELHDDIPEFTDLQKQQRLNEHSWSAMQNFISLLKLIDSESPILFLEDDCEFDFTDTNYLEQCLVELPEDFDLFNLGPYHFQTPSHYSENLLSVNGAWLFHAVVMSPIGIKKVIKLLEDNKFRTPDLTIGMVKYLQNGLNYYSPKLTIAYQKEFESNISKQVESKNVPKNAVECTPIKTPEMLLNPNVKQLKSPNPMQTEAPKTTETIEPVESEVVDAIQVEEEPTLPVVKFGKFADSFSKSNTFLINLKRNNHRLHLSTLACNKIGLQFTTVSAIDAQKEKLPEYIPSEEFDLIRFNKAAYALAKTTAKIIRKAIKQNLEYVLIMEDDVEWHPKTKELLDKCIHMLPDNWKLFYFSQIPIIPSHSVSSIHQKTNNMDNSVVVRLVHTFSCASYVVKKDAYEEYLAFLEKADRPIDNWLIEKYQGEESVCYGTHPALAWQRSGHSDIQDGFLDYTRRLKADFTQ